jgi:glycosyltransferase involved in cell wall biosynthesis
VVKRLGFAVPGDLATPTGGYAYDRRMIAELKNLGWTVDVINLGDGFPWPDKQTLATAETRLMMSSTSCPIMVDGLALGVMPEAARRMRAEHSLVALVHHPLALETGLSAQQIKILRDSERAALAAAKHVIVTSDATAQELTTNYDVAADKITVVRPGNDVVSAAAGSVDGTVRVLSVGALVPRKGFDSLLAALATLTDLPWHLTIAGDASRDPQTAAQIKADIVRLKLEGRVSLPGAVSERQLADLYSISDLFALASRFEGYGMAYSEAIAYGLPVVATRAGAVGGTLPPDAAILVDTDDVAALARALRSLIASADMRRQFSDAARVAGAMQPRWRDSAKIMASVLEILA